MGTFKHFYHRDYQERTDLISEFAQLSDAQKQQLISDHQAKNDQLIENYLTDYALPEGVAVNLVVNGDEKVVPMVTEEPSVIAAASNGARLLSRDNGIEAKVLGHNLMGQIVVKTDNVNLLIGFVNTHFDKMIEVANQAHPSILKYGGGAKEVRVRQLDETYCSIDLFVNVGEAMGANMMNTMLEALAAFLTNKIEGTILMSILSNYGEDSLVQVQGAVAVNKLATAGIDGKTVAKQIVAASHIAQIDPYRAATHNKGIMNGIDAVVMAMGNDWRAVEAGIHSFASQNGQYRGLSDWQINGDQLVGKLTIPLSLGFIGGATKVFDKVKINQQIAKVTSKEELSEVVAAIGLAQNLAALKALVSEGIQKGHMGLQLNSLAITAGATEDEVTQVVQQLKQQHQADLASAEKILKSIRNNEGE